jgi:hypothetical protein
MSTCSSAKDSRRLCQKFRETGSHHDNRYWRLWVSNRPPKPKARSSSERSRSDGRVQLEPDGSKSSLYRRTPVESQRRKSSHRTCCAIGSGTIGFGDALRGQSDSGTSKSKIINSNSGTNSQQEMRSQQDRKLRIAEIGWEQQQSQSQPQ